MVGAGLKGMSEKHRCLLRFEKKLITGFSGLLVLNFLVHLLGELITSYNYSVFQEQADLYKRATGISIIDFCNPVLYTPRYHVISVVVFLGFVFGRKFYFASILTFVYFAVLLNAVNWRIENAGLIDPSTEPMSRYAMAAWNWIMAVPSDLMALAFLLPLLVWELTILFRVLRQALKSPQLT